MSIHPYGIQFAPLEDTVTWWLTVLRLPELGIIIISNTRVLRHKNKESGSIRSHFEIDASLHYDKAVHAYLRLIVFRSAPIRCVEEFEFRNFLSLTSSLVGN